MSARRQARTVAAAPPADALEIPRALLVGRCVEVWADPAHRFDLWSASSRFEDAREAWLHSVGRGDVEPFTVISDHAPWRLAEEPARLTRSGCTSDDVSTLRAEAERLLIGT